MKVYLVRHGQVPHNATKQYNVGDEDLTEVGVEQGPLQTTCNFLKKEC